MPGVRIPAHDRQHDRDEAERQSRANHNHSRTASVDQPGPDPRDAPDSGLVPEQRGDTGENAGAGSEQQRPAERFGRPRQSQ